MFAEDQPGIRPTFMNIEQLNPSSSYIHILCEWYLVIILKVQIDSGQLELLVVECVPAEAKHLQQKWHLNVLIIYYRGDNGTQRYSN